MVRLREHNHTSTHLMSIMCHSWIWNLIVRFEESNERLIVVNYGYNQTVGFRERHGQ